MFGVPAIAGSPYAVRPPTAAAVRSFTATRALCSCGISR